MAYVKSLKDQEWLLPPRIEDLIPEDHVCFLVECVVESMDYSSYDVRYSGQGHPAYHPQVIIKLIVMAMLDRTRSSRVIARFSRENVVYMYLAEKLQPDFRTISDFRKNNLEIIKEVFKKTVVIAKKLGLVGLQHLCLDGTRIKASASNNSVVSKEELAILDEFVKNELKEGLTIDETEDKLYDSKRGNDQLDTKSKRKLKSIVKGYLKRMNKDPDSLEKIKITVDNAKQELENKGLNRVSLTDAEARFMKHKKGGILFSYNPQVIADSTCGIIVANEATNEEDTKQLQSQVLQAEATLGDLEGAKFLADNNYFEGENLGFLSEKGIDAYIPDQVSAARANGKKIEEGRFSKSKFKYDSERDLFICPEGKELAYGWDYQRDGKTVRVYRTSECKTCPFVKECSKAKKGPRLIKSYPHERERRDMIEKMKTPEAKRIYKMRARTVEPAIGHVKQNLGFREFNTRGKTREAEFNIACIANNLRRIWNRRNSKTGEAKMSASSVLMESEMEQVGAENRFN